VAGRVEDPSWGEVPVFGERLEAEVYVVRPSAYALVEDRRRRIAVVRSVDGIFLPGGGIEAGETPQQAICREALEECGLVLRNGAWALRAVQFSFSRSENAHFEKRSIFLESTIEGADSARLQPDHELIWASAPEAGRLLSHASHSWAVERWSTRQGR
jgi:8-oxo-dGTP diphosphatase